MTLGPIFMLIMVVFLMDLQPEKSPERKSPIISLATLTDSLGS